MRAFSKLREKHKTRKAASMSWKMLWEQRFDHRVRSLADFDACNTLLQEACAAFALPALARGLAPGDSIFNIIVRRYMPGDFLGRHVDDIRMFKEPIVTCVLQAGGTSSGLVLSKPNSLNGCIAAQSAALEVGASGLQPSCCDHEELGLTYH